MGLCMMKQLLFWYRTNSQVKGKRWEKGSSFYLLFQKKKEKKRKKKKKILTLPSGFCLWI